MQEGFISNHRCNVSLILKVYHENKCLVIKKKMQMSFEKDLITVSEKIEQKQKIINTAYSSLYNMHK